MSATVGRLEARAAEATPDAVAPPPHHPRFPLLDGMRAIAALCVLLVHVQGAASPGTVPADRILSHLNVGVTIFFLISGFLLYRPFIAQRARGPAAPPVSQYAKRRALRIFPAYWLALTLLTILPGTVGASGGQWLTQYTLTQNIPFTSNPSCSLVGCDLAQTWSLVVELTFYVTLPLWFLLAERFARGRPARVWVPVELATFGGALPDLSRAALRNFQLPRSSGDRRNRNRVHAVVRAGDGTRDRLSGTRGQRRPRWLRLLADRPWLPWVGALAIYAILCVYLPARGVFLTRSRRHYGRIWPLPSAPCC